MDELLKLLESHSGELILSLYRRDGMCWHKRGELKVNRRLIEELRAAVKNNSRLPLDCD